MAIKLVANYSKRLGLPGYSSHQFSVSVETELRDLAEADQEMSSLYHQLQRNVDAQIQQTGFVPSAAYGTQSSHRPSHQSNHQPRDEEPAQQDQWRCSQKQRSFIERIIKENNLADSDVDHLARQRFGISVAQLNKMQASSLIDALLDQYGSRDKGGPR